MKTHREKLSHMNLKYHKNTSSFEYIEKNEYKKQYYQKQKLAKQETQNAT